MRSGTSASRTGQCTKYSAYEIVPRATSGRHARTRASEPSARRPTSTPVLTIDTSAKPPWKSHHCDLDANAKSAT
ncbi:MAG: hypothetical protein ACKOOG_05670, partial [Actinomycetota bacterium]